MKICVYIPGGGASCGLDFPSRGESRWSLNWAFLLEKWGHEVHKIGDFDPVSPTTEYDLLLNAPWVSNYGCYTGAIKFKKHVHLCFGGYTTGISDTVCYKNGPECVVAAPYYEDHLMAVRQNVPPPFVTVPMPTPYSESMFPIPKDDPFLRREVSCLSKELWHPGMLERCPHVYRATLFQVRALLELQKREDFVFNFVEENINSAPDDLKELLIQFKFLNLFPLQPFTRVLWMLGNSKFLLPMGGTIGSSPDGCFAGALPLSNEGNVLNKAAVAGGFTLPYAVDCTQEDYTSKTLEYWFDRNRYEAFKAAYEVEFKHHREEYARKYFDELLQKVGLV